MVTIGEIERRLRIYRYNSSFMNFNNNIHFCIILNFTYDKNIKSKNSENNFNDNECKIIVIMGENNSNENLINEKKNNSTVEK